MENWKDQKNFKLFEIFDFFFCQAQFSLSSWIFCLDFTYIQPIYLCVKNYFNSRNPNNTQINYFLQTIAPLNFDCFLLKNSVSKFNILEKIIFDSWKYHLTHLFPTEMKLLKCSIVLVFLNWFYLRTKTQKLPKFLNLWNLCQAHKNSAQNMPGWWFDGCELLQDWTEVSSCN